MKLHEIIKLKIKVPKLKNNSMAGSGLFPFLAISYLSSNLLGMLLHSLNE